MNRAKRTARKRMHLLNRGRMSDPKSLLGEWAQKIWLLGRPMEPKAP